MYRDLREWIEAAEGIGQVLRIKKEVDWDEEMAAITYVAHRKVGFPALLFEKVKGYQEGGRVLFNMFGSSTKRIALTINMNPDSPLIEIIRGLREKLKLRIQPKWVSDGPVFENVVSGDDVDVYKLPAPKMWPLDGGRYLGTACTIITQDPESGRINLGTYRGMIMDRNKVGIYTSPGKDASIDMRKWWAMNKPCPVVAIYGVSPEIFFVSGLAFQKNVSELDVAGALADRPVEVVKGPHTGLPIPANVEIAAEGFIRPDAAMSEGPFGEFTGYYARPRGKVPYLEITALYYRNDPILTSSLMADYPSCDQSAYYAIGRSANIWSDLENMGVPGIVGVYAHPAAASGFGLIVVSIKQLYPGHASQVAHLAAQSMTGGYYTKVVIVVDDDIDPTDMDQVVWALGTRLSPERDVEIVKRTWSTWLDPSKFPVEERPWGSKLIIIACKDYKYIERFEYETTKIRRSTYEKVVSRWRELGLPGDPPEVKKLLEEAPEKLTEIEIGAEPEGEYFRPM